MKANRTINLRASIVVVVEGEDEQHTLEDLCEVHGIGDIQFIPFREYDTLKRCLELLKKTPGFQNVLFLGAIGDCEENREFTESSYENSFRDVELKCENTGWAQNANAPSCGFLLLPLAGQNGCLEDVYLHSVKHEAYFECSRTFLNCIENERSLQGKPEFNRAKKSKIISRGILLSHKPGFGLGRSFKASCWNQNSEEFLRIRNFLKEPSEINS